MLTRMARFFVLGSALSGKTSLILSLMNGIPQKNNIPTEGLDIYEWNPHDTNLASSILTNLGYLTRDRILIEFYDTTGKKCCWPILQSCLTYQDFVFLIVFDCTKESDISDTLDLIQLLHQKIPDAHVIIIATHSIDKVDYNTACNKLSSAITKQETSWTSVVVNQLNSLRDLQSSSYIINELHKLETLLTKKFSVHEKIISIDNDNQKDLDELMNVILKTAIEQTKYKSKAVDDKSLVAVQKDTNVLDGQTPQKSEKVKLESRGCADQWNLVNLACTLYFDDCNRSFKIDSGKFWPKGVAKERPSPQILAKLLEEIPTRGLLRELLLPLLWQVVSYNEQQMREVIDALIKKHMMLPDIMHIESHEQPPILDMPMFPSFGTQTVYNLPLLALPNRTKPTVNWFEAPFEDDVNVTVLFSFPHNDASRSLFDQIIAACHGVSTSCSYKYLWKSGILCKYNEEVTTHIYIKDASSIHACARGPFSDCGDVLPLLWLALKPNLLMIHSMLSELPGLIHKVDLVVSGFPLVTSLFDLSHLRGPNKAVIQLPLLECVSALLSGQSVISRDGFNLDVDVLFPFKDTLLTESPSNVFEAIFPGSFIEDKVKMEPPNFLSSQNKYENSTPKSQKKKKLVSWKAPELKDPEAEKTEVKKQEVLDEALKKHINRVAASLVTSAITSAVAKYLISKQEITDKQVPIVDALTNAVRAGCDGDSKTAVKNIATLVNALRAYEVTEKPKKSKICSIL